jgi:hypothetical protein
MFLRLCVCALLVVLLRPAWAQFETAVVLGTIRDTTGSAVVGCSVILEGVDTGVTSRTTTDNNGDYQFLNVKIGRYRVTAEYPGFKRSVSDPFSVAVSARQRVDLSLQVGEVTESVTVTEAAALLETDTSSRGTVIAQRPRLCRSHPAHAGHHPRAPGYPRRTRRFLSRQRAAQFL